MILYPLIFILLAFWNCKNLLEECLLDDIGLAWLNYQDHRLWQKSVGDIPVCFLNVL